MPRLLLLIACTALLAACGVSAEVAPRSGEASALTIVEITVIDAASGAALAADVRIDGKLIASSVTSASVSLPLDDKIHPLNVTAPGYEAWTLGIRSGGEHSRTISGPVRLVRSG